MPDLDASSSKQQPLLVLSKISRILDAFSLSDPVLTVSQIQRVTNLPSSTVQRLVESMTVQGMLERTARGLQIGARMAYWSATATQGLDVVALVQPVLDELRDLTGETTSFSVAEKDFSVCVAVAQTRHPLRCELYVGRIQALQAGSEGLVLISHRRKRADLADADLQEAVESSAGSAPADNPAVVERARVDGYAIVVGDCNNEASGLSAPVFDSAAEIIGTMTISGPAMRMPGDKCEQWVDFLVRYAERVTRTVGGRIPR